MLGVRDVLSYDTNVNFLYDNLTKRTKDRSVVIACKDTPIKEHRSSALCATSGKSVPLFVRDNNTIMPLIFALVWIVKNDMSVPGVTRDCYRSHSRKVNGIRAIQIMLLHLCVVFVKHAYVGTKGKKLVLFAKKKELKTSTPITENGS